MDALFLFDIDGTMVSTGGAGMRAMEQAGKDLYGQSFSTAGVEFAGRIDAVLVVDLLERNAVIPSGDEQRRFRVRYHECLRSAPLEAANVRALPGVHDLLATLGESRVGTLGLLTGNFQETGEIKLRACGIRPEQFEIAAWGDDGAHDQPLREHLPPVAMRRFHERYGRVVPAHRVAVIGDTPHDVHCAKVNACRVLAVATGKFSVDELAACGADRAVQDLSNVGDIARWLTGN